MEQYGWTLTEVRKQPYVKLLEILMKEKEETEEKQRTKSHYRYGFKKTFWKLERRLI